MAYVRHEYLKYGVLTLFGALLQLVAYGLQMVLAALSIWGSLWPYWQEYIPENWIGGALTVSGIVVCAIGMMNFRSMKRLFGRQSDQLIVLGIYRYSRNPQYIGFGLLILGFVVSHWSSTSWLAFVSYLILVAVTIWIEEQHLENLYGEAYRNYCQSVPRIIALRNKWVAKGDSYE